MRALPLCGLLCGLLLLGGLPGLAQPEIPPEARRSGLDQMAPETRAMQADDGANPGMLWALDGAELFERAPAPGAPSCAGCHADGALRGVAARYPAWDEGQARPVDLEGRINLCRTRHQGAEPLARESRELLALTAHIALQSRGLPVAPPADPRLDPARAAGRALFNRPLGQLRFSCAGCHDANWGRHLGAAPIPQGHPNGYPLYRLEWQGLGAHQGRKRYSLVAVRARA